jgi:beta-mannanase
VDAAIAQRAREVAALKVPVFFEYRWEMDRPNLASVVHSGPDYIKAWDRVRTVFRAQKVTNAQFVWCPLANGFASGRAQSYYPGDAQVDWICADLYSPINQATQSFATLSAPFLAWADPHHKPIMFGEFGAAATWGSAKRAEWISGIQTVVQAHPLIKALVYYNSDAGEARYSLSDDSRALGALAAVAKKFGAKAI